ncbi:MAG: RIP metalloprotease RseP [Deltaproteobacteria bacterium]|nr:RIP metalloprotease RseP [Deltaproteobacteria bacterium]MBI4373615.1 RIP metalloprotease RseP [Deltaproteobacteria bacterium]
MTIISFLFALGVLIFIHEFGHFLVAKRKKIGVEKFSLGFGPKLIGFQRGETTYMLSLLPFGGYVKLRGEEAGSADPNDPSSYAARPVGHRFGVVFAGPFMNLLLAALLMPLVFLIGRSEPLFWQEPPVVSFVQRGSAAETAGIRLGDRILKIGRHETSQWKDVSQEVILKAGEKISIVVNSGGEEVTKEIVVGEEETTKAGYLGVEPSLFIGNEPIIDGLMPDAPAGAAGFQVNDEVIAIDGVAVTSWSEMTTLINKGDGRPLQFLVRRGGAEVPIAVQPRQEESRWVIGIRKDYEKRGPEMVFRRYPLPQAVVLGFQENCRLSKMTLQVLGRLVSLKLSYKSLGGPIRIAQASGAAAKSGLSGFIFFLTFLSLQLGWLNLLPIPALDGGHLFFMLIEKVMRRPVSQKVRSIADQAGFAILILLMALVTLHDVESVWGFGKIFGWFKGLL